MNEETRTMRKVSISLTAHLLHIVDDQVNEGKYVNRSEAIRDLIRKGFESKEEEEGNG